MTCEQSDYLLVMQVANCHGFCNTDDTSSEALVLAPSAVAQCVGVAGVICHAWVSQTLHCKALLRSVQAVQWEDLLTAARHQAQQQDKGSILFLSHSCHKCLLSVLGHNNKLQNVNCRLPSGLSC